MIKDNRSIGKFYKQFFFPIKKFKKRKKNINNFFYRFYGFKPPILSYQKNFYLRKGLGFIYLSSKNSTTNWKLSLKSVNDSNSFLGRTLEPLYNSSSSEGILHLLYNDEPPSTPGSVSYGHSKGVVMSDGKMGLWLVHSTPKFPIEPVTINKINTSAGIIGREIKNKYFFPKTALKYGQSFLCITLPPTQINNLGSSLQYVRPKIYSHNVPPFLETKFSNIVDLVQKKLVIKYPYYKKLNLTTVGGRNFVSYVKSREFGKDLYSDWLSQDLQSDLQVETWSNGPNELPSDCNNKYHVMDVKEIEMRTIDDYVIKLKNSQDHSKWAISNSNSTMICVGDINRMVRISIPQNMSRIRIDRNCN